MLSPHFCNCVCHIGSVEALHVPPFLTDPVAAVTACSQCLNAHCPALLTFKERPKIKPHYRDTYPQADGEGAE